MNSLQQSIHKLMLSILPFEEFRVGDIVSDNIVTAIFLDFDEDGDIVGFDHEHKTSLSLTNEYTKFISRDWTLNDLLMAFQNVRKFHTTLQITNKGYLEYWEMEDCKWQVDFDLTKGVLEQSEEVLQKIGEIL